MFPLTDKDREVLERLGFKRSSVTGTWVKRFPDGPPPAGEPQVIGYRETPTMHWVFLVRRTGAKGYERLILGSPELIPSLVFAEIEGA